MVNRIPRATTTGLIFAGSLSLLLAGKLAAREISEYRLGDVVEADITTPVPLRVVDEGGTAALKEKEALRVPSIFRFDPATADAVEEEFRVAFTNTRSNFLERVQAHFDRRKLDEAELATEKFQRIVGTMLQQRNALPLTTNLAELWARGDQGWVVLSSVLTRLRGAMGHPIRPDFLPAGFKLSGQVWLVTVTNREQELTLDEAESNASSLSRTNLQVIWRARKELVATFPPGEEVLARAAAAAIRFNCLPEPELTQQARARHIEPIFVAENYDAGQVIARHGQIIDAKIRAALDQLMEKTEVAHMRREMGREQAMMDTIRRRNKWLWAGVAGLILLLLTVSWRLVRRHRAISLLPARLADGGASAAVLACPSCQETIVIPSGALERTSENREAWQERALTAEQRAERAQAAIRAGILPQLAEWLRHTFVRSLMFQRSQMLETQKTAAAEMAEMERRLNELRAPLEERLRAYEQRIAELEKLLEAKSEENRELLQAKIKLTRQRIQAERERNQLNYNWVVKH